MIATAPRPVTTATRPRTYEPFAEVNTAQLLEALITVSKAIPKKPSIKILANCLLERHGDKLTLTGFDTDQGISVTIPCSGSTPQRSRITLPAELLKKWLRSLKRGQQYLAISTAIPSADKPGHPDEIIVKFTGYLNNLDNEFAGLAADTYPDLPAADQPAQSITLDPAELKQAIAAIQRSIKKITHYEEPLNGIHFKATGTALRLTACDGNQASQTTLTAQQATEGFEANISAKFFQALNHPALAEAKTITLATAPGPYDEFDYVFVETPHIRLTGRTIPGKYPDFPDLAAETPEWTIEADRKALINQLAIACSYGETGQEGGMIRLRANAIAQTLTLAGNWTTRETITKESPEGEPTKEIIDAPYGSLYIELPATVAESDDCHISARMLQALLESMKAPTVKMAPSFPVLGKLCTLIQDANITHLIVHTDPRKYAVKLDEPTSELLIEANGDHFVIASERTSLRFAIALSDVAYLDLIRKIRNRNRIDLTRSELRSLLQRRLQ